MTKGKRKHMNRHGMNGIQTKYDLIMKGIYKRKKAKAKP